MISIILYHGPTVPERPEAIALCWDDAQQRALSTEPVDAGSLFGAHCEKRYCVARMRVQTHLETKPMTDADSFAAAMRDYALHHHATPRFLAQTFILDAKDEGIDVSLARVDSAFAMKRLPPSIRKSLDFLYAFFSGIPQTEQDRRIFNRLPVSGVYVNL